MVGTNWSYASWMNVTYTVHKRVIEASYYVEHLADHVSDNDFEQMSTFFGSSVLQG